MEQLEVVNQEKLDLRLLLPDHEQRGVMKSWWQLEECSVIPMVVLSESDLEQDIKQSCQLGANSLIIKPRIREELQKVVRIVNEYWAIWAKPKVPEKC